MLCKVTHCAGYIWPKPGVISAVLWLLVEDCYHMHRMQYEQIITNHTNIVTGLPTVTLLTD